MRIFLHTLYIVLLVVLDLTLIQNGVSPDSLGFWIVSLLAGCLGAIGHMNGRLDKA